MRDASVFSQSLYLLDLKVFNYLAELQQKS